MTMWGGQIRIISTHDGADNPFAELINDVRAGRYDYSLHRVTLTMRCAMACIARSQQLPAGYGLSKPRLLGAKPRSIATVRTRRRVVLHSSARRWLMADARPGRKPHASVSGDPLQRHAGFQQCDARPAQARHAGLDQRRAAAVAQASTRAYVMPLAWTSRVQATSRPSLPTRCRQSP
jgi:hypothetical protein